MKSAATRIVTPTCRKKNSSREAQAFGRPATSKWEGTRPGAESATGRFDEGHEDQTQEEKTRPAHVARYSVCSGRAHSGIWIAATGTAFAVFCPAAVFGVSGLAKGRGAPAGRSSCRTISFGGTAPLYA